jgi:V/A-type H+-transporting ATPase subunit A
MLDLRHKMVVLLQEEEKLNEIVQLVGEDVLPNDQALVLETARLIKKAYLQQNALHSEDTFVTLEKQYKMLKVIDAFYESAMKCVKIGIPTSEIRKQQILQDIYKMKFDIPNDNIELLDELKDKVEESYSILRQKYE